MVAPAPVKFTTCSAQHRHNTHTLGTASHSCPTRPRVSTVGVIIITVRLWWVATPSLAAGYVGCFFESVPLFTLSEQKVAATLDRRRYKVAERGHTNAVCALYCPAAKVQLHSTQNAGSQRFCSEVFPVIHSMDYIHSLTSIQLVAANMYRQVCTLARYRYPGGLISYQSRRC